MAYSGDTYPAKPFPFRMERPNVTYVSGAGPNIFGHVLFCFGVGVGYIHVDEFYAYPKLLTPTGFDKYMKDNEKTILHREYIGDMTNPQLALDEAERLRQIQWAWIIVPHNCVAFAEQIVGKGGSKWTSKTNLPALSAKVERTRDAINNSMNQIGSLLRYGMQPRPF